jgi:PAS domain S-box-containing protein
VEQNVGAAFLRTMQVLAGLLVLFWLAQFMLVRRGFLRWLRHLTAVAERFGKGDFTARAHVETRDELGQLAGAFNQMATEVEQSDTSLKAEINERKRTEEELFRVASIVMSSEDAILSKTLDGIVTSWNNGAERVYGYQAEEITGQHVLKLFPPELAAEEAQILEKITRGERIESYETARVRKDGRRIPVSLTVSPIKDAQGNVIGISNVARDITIQKQMEEELKKARDTALESARLKSEFLANMSHEIRTPMNGVIGMTGLLLDTDLDDEQRDFTETVRSSADSLLTIINDILDFSKIEAGKMHFEKVDFDLRAVVESTVELLADRAQAKGIELASLVDSSVPVHVRGDAGRLRQVLVNLVSNGVKFTETGEVTVCAQRESETDTHVTIRYAIKDTGIGIAPEAQRLLFQAFVQADGSTTRKYGGTGLGLAISKQLVELMGGEIGIESAPGQGSTFWFTARLEKQLEEAQTATPQSRADLHDLRVLVVDDNATNRRILLHQTTSWGMIASEAENGAAALESLRAARQKGEPFDVALLDFNMPGMDGFELTRAIKADANVANVRLVLMPSFGNRGDGQLAREMESLHI